MFYGSRAAKCLASIILIALMLFVGALSSQADVFGRLSFTVKNADDEKPVAGAKITLHDSAGVRADICLTTDSCGAAVSPPLEFRAWDVTVEADLFHPESRQVQVVGDTSTAVEVLLEPLQEKVVKITGQKQAVTQTQTANVTKRDQTFVKTFPVTVGNPQNLQAVIATVPGEVQDSVNQVHARGEHSSNTIDINGFELPGALQGRIGQVIVPTVIQSMDVITGNYSPEYGGECASIINMNLRSGPITPVESIQLGEGSYVTRYAEMMAGGQTGNFIAPASGATATGQAKQFDYFIDMNAYASDNVTNPPQPGDQTAHNAGESESLFGNFDFALSKTDQISLILNSDPADSQIANRSGLPDMFAPIGQGYGYAGHLSAAEAASEGIGSQQADGQNINQRDLNQFAITNWRHTINANTFSLMSLGITNSELVLSNSNPAINLNNLPGDNSIEFNPTMDRESEHKQVQGSVTNTNGPHTFKAGGLFDDQSR